jgi:hypothetical protein
MAESDSKPLADILFGEQNVEPARPDADLAEAISALVRASRSRSRGGSSGTPDAQAQTISHRGP